MNPTRDEITTWLVEQHAPTEWATFLDGLPWQIIRPGVQIARASKTHPALALGAAAVYSTDRQVKATISAHLDRHAAAQPKPD